jgi:4-amino-4-deoxy-L-arabinose transferase-like glycosyltransferase
MITRAAKGFDKLPVAGLASRTSMTETTPETSLHRSDGSEPAPTSRRVRGEVTAWTAAVVLLGLAARVVRWRADTPLWGDEAAVAQNLLDRGYRALAAALDLGQVAPLGFLWIERTLLLGFGSSEQALRLLAFVAGAASLLAFCWLARLVFSGHTHSQTAAALSVALLAVSYYPIRYSAELKPYALDLLVTCLLQCLALRWLLAAKRPRSRAALWALAALALAAPWFSYPSCFVGGGIALALLPAVLRDRSRATLVAYAGFAAALAAGCAGSYALVARAQTLAFDGSGAWLARFWADSFPPPQPLPFVAWLARTHSGMMFAYPNGGPNGGSTLTLLLFLIGIAAVARASARRRDAPPDVAPDPRRGVLGVLLAPFALAFLAAGLRLYPYGGPTRISLYLAPAICLFTGAGAAALLGRLTTPTARARATRVLLGALVLLGVATIVRDVSVPHGTRDAVTEGRRLASALAAEAPTACLVGLNAAQDLVIPREGPNGPQVSFRWYLRLAGGARWSGGRAGSVACRGRDLIRAVVFVDRGRPEPEARLGEWQRRLRDVRAGDATGADFRVVGEQVACTTPDCHEKVYVRDYQRSGSREESR